MVFVHIEHRIEFARIECVTVVIFVCDGKVECLHGIPAESIGVHLQYDALDCRARLDVVQQD